METEILETEDGPVFILRKKVDKHLIRFGIAYGFSCGLYRRRLKNMPKDREEALNLALAYFEDEASGDIEDGHWYEWMPDGESDDYPGWPGKSEVRWWVEDMFPELDGY